MKITEEDIEEFKDLFYSLLESLVNEKAETIVYDQRKSPTGEICTVPGCNHPVYAKGLCNAHYKRRAKGKDLLLKKRRTFKKGHCCIICGKPRNGHSSHCTCMSCYKILRNKMIKEFVIKKLGGRCSICGGVFNTECYDLHHVNRSEKEHDPSYLTSGGYSIERIFNEINKCILVCANCHRSIHKEKDLI